VRASHVHTFIGDGMSVLLVMQVEGLPNPLAMSWRTNPRGNRRLIHVQVDHDDFKTWLAQLQNAHLDTETWDGNLHVHAEGPLALAPDTRIHLLAVTDDPQEAPA